MYADPRASSFTAQSPRRQRAEGRIVFEAGRFGSATRTMHLAESGPLRLRFPNAHGPRLEAVMMNTGGGIACGDRMNVQIAAKTGSEIVITSPAAERIYRSDGDVSEIHVRLNLERGARLSWLPQETILYDHARARRSFEAEIAADSRLAMFEAIMFGRSARGERMTDGLLHDRWRIRREDRLVFAEDFHLQGPIHEQLARPSITAGATAIATFLYVAPDAEARLEAAREHLVGAECACGASTWNGLLSVRFLAPEIGPLRRSCTAFLTKFLGHPLPRVWHG
ncbi:urease accessory protein UreD [Terrihabitans sp. B22-R8]|uniref:urease accessory protein UreD n=1 Tax=Terrihabitans sp. B22-R8 TaxID=3425128 RepID=UPI00403C0C32